MPRDNAGTRFFDRTLTILAILYNMPGVMDDPDIRATIIMRPEDDLEGCRLICNRIMARYGITEGKVVHTTMQMMHLLGPD